MRKPSDFSDLDEMKEAMDTLGEAAAEAGLLDKPPSAPKETKSKSRGGRKGSGSRDTGRKGR
jgi:hypothetical protein